MVAAAELVAATELPNADATARPVKVRDYIYTRKGSPPIKVKAHGRGLPRAKPKEVYGPTGAL